MSSDKNTTLLSSKSILLICVAFLGCFFLLGIRVLISGKFYQIFLAWNLFLAVIPFFIALLSRWLVTRNHGIFSVLIFLFTSILWLLFFPNSSYIFTDFIHLIQRGLPEDNPNARGFSNLLVWYDVIVRSLYAFVGHLLGLASLFIFHNLWSKYCGKIVGWVLVISSCTAAAYGVFVGRFIRLNSWNLVTHPDAAVNALLSNVESLDAVIFTIAFAFFLSISYIFLYIFKKYFMVTKELP